MYSVVGVGWEGNSYVIRIKTLVGFSLKKVTANINAQTFYL
jgi:hypothetical protein